MSQIQKLVLKSSHKNVAGLAVPIFEIVKTVNTIEFGIPGTILEKKDVESLMARANNISSKRRLVIEIIDGRK